MAEQTMYADFEYWALRAGWFHFSESSMGDSTMHGWIAPSGTTAHIREKDGRLCAGLNSLRSTGPLRTL